MDRFISDTLIENPFSEHVTDTFLSIRRHSDIWTWGNLVLWPGMLGNSASNLRAPTPKRTPSFSEANTPISFVGGDTPISFGCVADEPACGEVGPEGIFRSGYGSSATNLTAVKGGCTDHVWSDGPFPLEESHATHATAWTVGELVDQMNQFDWTEGIMIQQVRV